MTRRTLIIAEAGVNHNGELDLAKKLIDAAADAGADMVKFQTFKSDSLVTAAGAKADYQRRTTSPSESQREMLRRLELTPEMHRDLIAHCKARGIAFFSAAFDNESIDLLVSLGQTMFKIPSGQITDLVYLRKIGGLGKPVILSTGMATMEEIERAVAELEKAGTPRSRITVLHCTTEYPTPMEDVNLGAMNTIREKLGVEIGYSDHTPGIEIPTAAVAMGASVIEKHFTLDRSLPGPDHQASLEPAELKAMVRAIRNVEIALGDGVKRPVAGETNNAAVARKSLVAARPIKAGERFTDVNITAKRPGTGISPMRLDEILGRNASRDFAVDELIEL